ncbi:heterokaryon incompatibility protein [Stagonosporopsis vannaccii]|nr:heterokaryon incompatibility protein [Stagonosporopsis vannaccii]
MPDEEPATSRAEEEILPTSIVDVTIDLSRIARQGLCEQCRKLSEDRFMFWGMETQGRYTLHLSVLSLQDSVRRGCPFCMFLWKQLGVTSASRYPECRVQLLDHRNLFSPKLVVCLNDSHLHKGERATPKGDGAYDRAAALISVDLHPSHDLMNLKFWGNARHIPIDSIRLRPLTGNTGSSGTMQRIVEWLKDCDLNHPHCSTYSVGSFVPTRLLDVSQWYSHKTVCLVGSQELPSHPVQYVTLSHRWDSQVKATATTKTNMSTRLKHFMAVDLPKCFTDTFEATINVGFRYLWIDSLCIVQDDPADWEREASLMSEIYRNASFTISASLEFTETAGLFRTISVENESAELPVVNQDGTSATVGFYKNWKTWSELVSGGPLQSRGWCLQERELSPRIVYWTPEQVAWECRTWSTSEHNPEQYRARSLVDRAFDNVETASDSDLLNLWHITVQGYASRALSVAADCFPALGGLARVMNERLRSEYVAGMWTVDLARSLLWRGHGGSHDTYIAPSWSWAAVKGAVAFPPYSIEQVSYKVKGLAAITHYQVDLCTADPYGAIKSGSLHLRGPLLTGYLVAEGHVNRCRLDESPNKEPHSTGYGYAELDDEAATRQPHAVKCVALFAQPTHPNWVECPPGDVGCGVVLVPVAGSPSTYRRVGRASDLHMELFAAADEEDMVVI